MEGSNRVIKLDRIYNFYGCSYVLEYWGIYLIFCGGNNFSDIEELSYIAKGL